MEEEAGSSTRPVIKAYIAAVTLVAVVASAIELFNVNWTSSDRLGIFLILAATVIYLNWFPTYSVQTKFGVYVLPLEKAALVPLMLVFSPYLAIPVMGIAVLISEVGESFRDDTKIKYWDLDYLVTKNMLAVATVAPIILFAQNHWMLWVTIVATCLLLSCINLVLDGIFAQLESGNGFPLIRPFFSPEVLASQIVEICLVFVVYALVVGSPLRLIPALVLLLGVQLVLRKQSSSTSEEKRLDALFSVGLEAQLCHTSEEVEILICARTAELLSAKHAAIMDEKPNDGSLSVPIMSQRHRWLVVGARGRPYRHFDQQMLQGIGLITSQALQATTLMRELERQALSDALTGLSNRRAFTEGLTQALARRDRTAGTIVVCYIDLDFFKEINDTYGHDSGDAVLSEFASRLRKSVRSGDLVARLGGDEFVVAALDVDLSTAVTEIPDKILDASQTPITLPNGTMIVVKPSIGVAVAPQDGHTAEAVLAVADSELYNAKRTGRGRYSLTSTSN